jgi:hypothetical protein
MHRGKKRSAGTVNAGDLPQVNFDLFARASRQVPGAFGFANPGAAKSASEIQPTMRGVLVNHNS